jgi:hypothetical protein
VPVKNRMSMLLPTPRGPATPKLPSSRSRIIASSRSYTSVVTTRGVVTLSRRPS